MAPEVDAQLEIVKPVLFQIEVNIFFTCGTITRLNTTSHERGQSKINQNIQSARGLEVEPGNELGTTS